MEIVASLFGEVLVPIFETLFKAILLLLRLRGRARVALAGVSLIFAGNLIVSDHTLPPHVTYPVSFLLSAATCFALQLSSWNSDRETYCSATGKDLEALGWIDRYLIADKQSVMMLPLFVWAFIFAMLSIRSLIG